MDDYRSWTKVDWTKIGLDENRIGRKASDQNLLDEKSVYHHIYIIIAVNLHVWVTLKPVYDIIHEDQL